MNSQQIVPRAGLEEEELRKERRAARRLRRRQQRRARIILWSTISLSALLLLVIGFFYLQIQNILAINAINAAYPPINGITCDNPVAIARSRLDLPTPFTPAMTFTPGLKSRSICSNARKFARLSLWRIIWSSLCLGFLR